MPNMRFKGGREGRRQVSRSQTPRGTGGGLRTPAEEEIVTMTARRGDRGKEKTPTAINETSSKTALGERITKIRRIKPTAEPPTTARVS